MEGISTVDLPARHPQAVHAGILGHRLPRRSPSVDSG